MRTAATISLALLSTASLFGCADRACFQWSETEGACPNRQEALSFMPSLDCVNFTDDEQVLSVDSEGDFEGDVCCYDVTYGNPSRDCRF